MKLRETYLKSIVTELFGEGSKEQFKFSYSDLSQNGKSELSEVYKSLGGTLQVPPTRFGGWDIVTPNFIVELDEEQHFNRYRAETLKSSIYDYNSSFSNDNYVQYCKGFEAFCLKKASFGKYWTSPSTEKQFGAPGNKGDFSAEGSPRWKQRAFYDFCRDLYSKEFGFMLVRLSIYDKVKTSSGFIDLGLALERGVKTDLVEFLKGMLNGK
jgi:hypothetical protein